VFQKLDLDIRKTIYLTLTVVAKAVLSFLPRGHVHIPRVFFAHYRRYSRDVAHWIITHDSERADECAKEK